MLPLADIRILAVEQFGAGPWATLQLADLGAEVIKIEDPASAGDVGRYVPPFQEGEDSLFFETFNRNKKSVSLDLRDEAGRERFEALVRVTDVVFSNLRGDQPAKLRLLYDDLKHLNPRIVCCSLSGFGMTGPRAAEGGYDYMMQPLLERGDAGLGGHVNYQHHREMPTEDRHPGIGDVPSELEQSAAESGDYARAVSPDRGDGVFSHLSPTIRAPRGGHPPMSKSEILERERRWSVPAAIACGLSVVLTVASVVLLQGIDVDPDASTADTYADYHEESSTLYLSAILRLLSMFALAGAVLYLFRAAQARSDRVRGNLVGIVVIGPILFGISNVMQTALIDGVAPDLAAAGGTECAATEFESETDQDDCVTNLVQDQGLFGLSIGLGIAGTIAFIASVLYTSLQAMRTGLLTRFWGSLGMAIPIAVVFLGPMGGALLILWTFMLGLAFLNRWPGGRPPAWDAGEAIPWPRPGEAPPEPEPEPQAEIEGSAEEILGTDAPETGTEGTGPAPRKRKRRS